MTAPANQNEVLLHKVYEERNTILERITDAFVALDSNWCYTYMNKKAGEIFGRNPEQMIGKNIWTEFPEGIGQPFYKAYYKAMAEQKYIYLEEHYQPYDLWFENHIYPSPDGLSIYFSDITIRKKAEEKIANSESRFRALIENMEGIISIIDKDFNFLFRSSSAVRITGWTHEEYQKTNAKEFLHPEDVEIVEQTMGKAIVNPGTAIFISFRTKHKNGHYIWMEGIVKNLLHDPIIGGIVINMMDVTEKKKTEESLRISDERLKHHLHNTPLAIIEWDKNLIIQKWSAQAEHIFGWKESDVINKHFNDFGLVFEDDAKEVGIIAEELTTGTVDQNNISNRNNTKSGRVIYCQWFNSVLKDEHGNTTSIMSLIKDITDSKNAELKVIQANQRFEMISHATNDAVFDLDLITGESYHNEAFLKLFNTNIYEGNVKPDIDQWKSKIHPDDKERVINKLQASFAGSSSNWEDEFRFQKADGTYGTYFDRGYINRDASGKAIGMVGSMIDITEIKKAEIALAESENYLRTILQTEPECVKILNLKGELLSMNPAGLAMIEADNEEQVLGHKMVEIVDPKYRLAFTELSNEVFKGNSGKLEFEITGLKGSHQWLKTHAVPMKDSEGKITSLLGVTINITDIKKAEEKIKESEERYHSLFENSGEAILLTSIDGQIFSANPAAVKIFGMSEEEICKAGRNGLVNLKDPRLEPLMKERKRTGMVKGELTFIKKDGTEFSGEINSTVFKNSKGEERTSMIIRDISERKKTEKEISQANEELRNLSAHLQNIREEERTTIAREIHDELGQKLTGLKMDAAWISKKVKEEDNSIHEKLSDMLALIDDTVKTVRRISTDLRPGILDDLGLVPALEWQSQEFEKRSGIATQFNTNLKEIYIEENLSINVFRVYQESLTNILRHANATKIETRFEKKNGDLILTIKDNGVGFDLAEIKSKKSLGLIGMKERALLFQGELNIDSQKHKGTVITLKVPNGIKNK